MPSSVMSFHSLFAHLLTVNSNQSSQVYGVEMLEVVLLIGELFQLVW